MDALNSTKNLSIYRFIDTNVNIFFIEKAHRPREPSTGLVLCLKSL